MNNFLIRVNSHKAREKLEKLLGYLPQGFFSFYRKGEWREVPLEKQQEILSIKGITRSRWKEDLHQYISWG